MVRGTAVVGLVVNSASRSSAWPWAATGLWNRARQEELGPGGLAGRFVAAVLGERLVGDHGRQPVGVVELPVVDEAVVAGGTLEVRPEEHLPHVLGELQLDHLAGVHLAAPLDPFDETLGLGRRRDLLADELVVRLVVEKRLVQPAGDLLPPAVDVPGCLVLVAEQVIPEREPVIGVARVCRRAVGGREVLRLFGAESARYISSLLGTGSRPMRSRKAPAGERRVVERRRAADL